MASYMVLPILNSRFCSLLMLSRGLQRRIAEIFKIVATSGLLGALDEQVYDCDLGCFDDYDEDDDGDEGITIRPSG